MEFIYFATFFVALISSVLSGIAGGGGGFIMSPYWLISGMTPAQGAATGAFMATGMSISSTAAFKNSGHLPRDKRLFYILSSVALGSSLCGAIIVPKIDVEAFKLALALINLISLPLIFTKPNFIQHIARHRNAGLFLAASLLVIGSIINSSAFSILFALALMSFFDMSVLQMTALRRVIGIVQSVVLFIAFAAQGYVVWQHAIAGFIGGSIGSYAGTKFAVKQGESSAKYALAAMSAASAIALLV